jgi:hypothetical protein
MKHMPVHKECCHISAIPEGKKGETDDVFNAGMVAVL